MINLNRKEIIVFDEKGSTSVRNIKLGQQWETNVLTLQFQIPDVYQNFNKYIIAVYQDLKTTKIFPMGNGNDFKIPDGITCLWGNWNLHVMCREFPLDLIGNNIDISAKDGEKIWVSNEVIGRVEKTFDRDKIRGISQEESLRILYDDLIKLKLQFEEMIERGVEDGFSPIIESTPNEDGVKVSITDREGLKEFELHNGQNGEKGEKGDSGEKGEDGFSPIINVEEVENGHKVSIQDKNDTKEFVILNGTNGRDGKDGTNGIDGRDGIDGVTPNLTIGNVTTLSSDQEATATITGTKENPVLNLGLPKGKDGQTATSDGTSSITKDTYGEKLIAEYIHQGNQEIHFIEFDWETGIGTTSEPHGLTGSHRIIIVPNDWHTVGHKNLVYIPNEWLIYTSYIHVTYVSGNQLKVTGSDASTIITVNSSDPRQNIDITKFHLEIPIDWNITNLNISRSRRLKVIIQGYLRSITYRYMRVDGKFQDTPEDKTDNIFWTSNYLGIPKIIRIAPNTIHGLFAMIEHTFDMSLPLHCYFRQNTTVWGKRSWDSSTYFSHDQNTETQIMYYNITKTIKMIDSIACSNGYGMISNYSVIRVYKMSEEPQDE